MDSIARFIKLYGTQTSAAKALGVSQATVWSWLHGHKSISAKNALKIEILTQGSIRREDLRPDIYGPVGY